MFFDLNIWAILAGGVAATIIGFAWYAPVVFGNTWMKAAGINPEHANEGKRQMVTRALIGLIFALVLSWVMAHFAIVWGAFTVGSALELGFWIWLGFMVPLQISPVLWEKKSITYCAVNAGYWFVTTLCIAVIVALWI